MRVIRLSGIVLKSAGSILLCHIGSGDPFMYFIDIILNIFILITTLGICCIQRVAIEASFEDSHLSVVAMNTVLFSTDVAAAAF